MPGKGKLVLTGKLGEVMQESAQAALSYVRTRSRQLRLPDKFYENVDIHIHVPEGAIPKDGPSAGIALATSIVSALTRRPVKRDLAMTGEITLRGRVLPIGGLKEKVLAAHRGLVTRVLIPDDNRKDIEEIPKRILKRVELIPVAHMDQVLREALVLKEGEEHLFAPDEACQPFCIEAMQEPPKPPAPDELTAH
jgi:ATP-dependent Lon protease